MDPIRSEHSDLEFLQHITFNAYIDFYITFVLFDVEICFVNFRGLIRIRVSSPRIRNPLIRTARDAGVQQQRRSKRIHLHAGMAEYPDP